MSKLLYRTRISENGEISVIPLAPLAHTSSYFKGNITLIITSYYDLELEFTHLLAMKVSLPISEYYLSYPWERRM